MIRIDEKKCNACGLCRKSCAFEAITIQAETAVVNEACTGCGSCFNVCPSRAVIMERKAVSTEELARYAGVFVWAECEKAGGFLKPIKVVFELLSKGRKLADKLKQELTAVVLGEDRITQYDELAAYGADRILQCSHPLLQSYTADGFCHVLSAAITDRKPAIVLYGATSNGRELAPRVAARLRLGLTADCTGLDIDEKGQLLQTRPAFGGNIMASIITPRTRPQTCTVRPNVFPAIRSFPQHTAIVENMEVRLSRASIRTRAIEEVRLESGGINLEEARVVVAAGRGCSGDTDLIMINQLAKLLNGAPAGSRPLVEERKISHTQQVGQSGLTIGPELYIAFGISGAVQHVVGMSASKTVIAVNRDPEAPIFRIADLGIVGDAREILPSLLRGLGVRRKHARSAF